MKKIFFSSLFILIFWILSGNSTFAQSCETAKGPSKDLSEYYNSITQELQTIRAQSRLANGECGFIEKYSQKAKDVFDIWFSNFKESPGIFVDFAFNTNEIIRGDDRSAYLRDIQLFDQLEKQIENTATNLSNSCKLIPETRVHLGNMVTEVMEMRSIFQQTALGFPPSTFEWVRESNKNFALEMTKSYTRAKNHDCTKTNPDDQWFFTSLKNILNFGDKKERMIETWKRAAALITGDGISSAEYATVQRNLLQAELDRQWITSNMKNVILRNFDCYKAKTAEKNDIETAMKARFECFSIPVAGTEKIFNAWNKMVLNSKTTEEFTERQQVKFNSFERAVDIQQMHNSLQTMISDAQDISDTTKTNLISLHIALEETNKKLEWRIPYIQNNCMKWQPDIVGWCRD